MSVAASGITGREREVEVLTSRLEHTRLATHTPRQEGGEGEGGGGRREKGPLEEERKALSDSPGLSGCDCHMHGKWELTLLSPSLPHHSSAVVRTQGQAGSAGGRVTETSARSEGESGRSHDWQPRSHD